MAFGKVKPQTIAHPSCSTRRLPERLPLLEHLRVLKISRQIVDRMGRPVEVDDHDEQREVNARFHAVALWTPCSPHERPWQLIDIRSPGRLDLCKISAEIADDIGTTEVDWQPPERIFALAPRAGQSCDDALTVITQLLMRCPRHSRKIAPPQWTMQRHFVRACVVWLITQRSRCMARAGGNDHGRTSGGAARRTVASGPRGQRHRIEHRRGTAVGDRASLTPQQVTVGVVRRGSSAAGKCSNQFDLQRPVPTLHVALELCERPSTTRLHLDGKERASVPIACPTVSQNRCSAVTRGQLKMAADLRCAGQRGVTSQFPSR
jgi:hypothetical protein